MKILGINNPIKIQRPNFKGATIIQFQEVQDKFTPSEDARKYSKEQKRFFDIFSRLMEIKKKEDKKFDRNFTKYSKFKKSDKSPEKELLEKKINSYLEKEFMIFGPKLEHFKKLAKIAYHASIGTDEKTTDKIIKYVYDNQEKLKFDEVVKFSTENGILNFEKADILIDLAQSLSEKESLLVTLQMLEKYAKKENGKFDKKIVEDMQVLYDNLHSNKLVEELLRTAKNPKTKEIDEPALKKIADFVDNYSKEKKEKEKTPFIKISKDDWKIITSETTRIINIARDKKTGAFNPNYRAKIIKVNFEQ